MTARGGDQGRRASTGLVMLAAVTLAGWTVAAQAPGERVAIDASGGKWFVETARAAAHVRIAPYLGRDALWLKNSAQVIRGGLDFADGTIEFDLAPMDRGDFLGIVFRRVSFQDHENVYVRLGRSDFMALQYSPRVGGSSTWQLHREFTAVAQWPRNQWTHIRMEVRGSRLEMFVGRAATPALSVARLRNGTTHGELAFWARVNDKPEEWAAAISNLEIRPAASPTPLAAAADAPPEFVRVWEVSQPLPAADASALANADRGGHGWILARAEDSGIVNVNRLFPVQKTRSVIYARKHLRSDAARRVLAGIGYSDDVTVFLNGEPLYSGVNGWDSRVPQFASFVDARFEKVWLPLREGDNELVLAVADDQRFGWGFSVRIDDRTGIRYENPSPQAFNVPSDGGLKPDTTSALALPCRSASAVVSGSNPTTASGLFGGDGRACGTSASE